MYSYIASAKKVHITDAQGNILFSHFWHLGFDTLEADTNHGRSIHIHCKKDEEGWPILKDGWVVHPGWMETGLDNDEEWDLIVHPRAVG